MLLCCVALFAVLVLRKFRRAKDFEAKLAVDTIARAGMQKAMH
jgi:hypothetical protein